MNKRNIFTYIFQGIGAKGVANIGIPLVSLLLCFGLAHLLFLPFFILGVLSLLWAVWEIIDTADDMDDSITSSLLGYWRDYYEWKQEEV